MTGDLTQATVPAATAMLIPLWIKLAFTAFLAVLVPYYWREYGPSNFLFFCDVALFLTLAALWLESPVLASAALVGILLPQLIWMVDFLMGFFDASPIGATAYMFDSKVSLFARFLSFFHFWLPLLLVYLVWKLGYDARGLLLWTGIALVVLPVCYFFFPGPSPDSDAVRNINYVYGFSDKAPQAWMGATQWFLVVLIGTPLLVYLPTHFAVKFLAPSASAQPTTMAVAKAETQPDGERVAE